MSDQIQEFMSGDSPSAQEAEEQGQVFAEGGASAGSSGGARQAGPPPPTPEPSVPAETAEDDAGRDAAGADADASSAAAPRAIITISQGNRAPEINFDIEFEPTYSSDDPAAPHTVAIALLDLASRYMGQITDLQVE